MNAKTTKDKIKLIRPSMDYAEDIMAYRREFLEHDPEEDMGGSGNLRECTRAEEWIAYTRAVRDKKTCPAELVDSDTYIAVRELDDKIVGIIDFRHHIDHPILGVWGGHIGYCVRPCERRKGYGKEMLRLDLIHCKNYGLRQVMITCDEGNVASERTIRSNGGIYEKTVWSEELKMYMKRFWVSLL